MSGADQIVLQLTRIADALERRSDPPSRAAPDDDLEDQRPACEACGRRGERDTFDYDTEDGVYLCKEGGECDERAKVRRGALLAMRTHLLANPGGVHELLKAAERYAQRARAFGDAATADHTAACAAAVDAEEALRLAARRLLDPDAKYVYAPTEPAPTAAPVPGEQPL